MSSVKDRSSCRKQSNDKSLSSEDDGSSQVSNTHSLSQNSCSNIKTFTYNINNSDENEVVNQKNLTLSESKKDDYNAEFTIVEPHSRHYEKTLTSEQDYSIDNERIVSKSLGAFGGFSIVVGIIIGSGIFISVMKSLQVFSPSLGALSLLWLFGGVISLIGGLCYVQLGIMLPASGGERTYLSTAFGRQFGIIFTIGYCFLVKTLALAGISQTFGKYFIEMIRGDYINTPILENLISAIVIFILFIINSISKELANKTQILFTILKLLAISGIIVIGVVFIGLGKGYSSPNPFHNSFKVENLRLEFLATALINIFWAYEGWNSLGAIVGEMKNPKRDLPISVIFGTVVVAVVYCLTILSYVAVLGYETVENTETVAAVFASRTIPKARWVIPLFICISTFGACNGTILSVSRIIMTAAVNGDIPGIFGLVRRKQRTPIIALLVPSILSMIFLLLPFQKLLQYCAFITWFFYGLTMAACIKLYWRHTNLDRSFRLPTIFPVIIIILSLYIVIMCFISHLKASCILTFFMILIFGIHFLPDRILKPTPLKNAHYSFRRYLSKMFTLEMADIQDIS